MQECPYIILSVIVELSGNHFDVVVVELLNKHMSVATVTVQKYWLEADLEGLSCQNAIIFTFQITKFNQVIDLLFQRLPGRHRVVVDKVEEVWICRNEEGPLTTNG